MSDTFSIITASETETMTIGRKMALAAEKGDCIALFGTLGMGKSVLARAFVQELTAAREVPSPTFTLVQMYDAPDFTIYHFDLYRLKSADEIFELGMEEALYEGVSLIEWPEKMGGYLPRQALRITITPKENSRLIEFSGSEELINRMRKAVCS